jgi:hypothetical protein
MVNRKTNRCRITPVLQVFSVPSFNPAVVFLRSVKIKLIYDHIFDAGAESQAKLLGNQMIGRVAVSGPSSEPNYVSSENTAELLKSSTLVGT